MIRSLRIKNLATIEEIELDFKDGFSILTGETGAGKSIIIDGIKLVLGEKGSSDVVRTGESQASIEAVFYLPHESVKDNTPFQENEIFIQRLITKEGTGKAYLNGVLIPLKKLREISSYLIDIYGQNDHDFLLHVENHLNYLDYFANAIQLRDDVAHAAQALRSLNREKKELEAKEKGREQRLDFLTYQIKEIEDAGLKPNEEDTLQYERHILKNAEKISSFVEKALAISYTQENSVYSLLDKLQNTVVELGEFDKTFKETNDSINQFSIIIKEFSDFLIKFQEDQIVSPDKLESIEERLSLIEKLKRKYGNSIPEILSYLKKAKDECGELSTSQEKLEDIAIEIENKFNDYMMKAKKLTKIRKEKAQELEKNILSEAALLGMKKAKFRMKIDTVSPSLEEIEKARESGIDEVEFLISPNPGEELRPLRKIASGGELSRIMLALKSIGKERGWQKTLIFDEIDSGIGGKTAEFVSKKLNQLSHDNQIICITHLPQIASFAFHHYKIDKKIDKERTYTTVQKLGYNDRITEIARLLSGARITETSLQNAREMLNHNLQEQQTQT